MQTEYLSSRIIYLVSQQMEKRERGKMSALDKKGGILIRVEQSTKGVAQSWPQIM